jgi:hypothetical protein
VCVQQVIVLPICVTAIREQGGKGIFGGTLLFTELGCARFLDHKIRK